MIGGLFGGHVLKISCYFSGFWAGVIRFREVVLGLLTLLSAAQ